MRSKKRKYIIGKKYYIIGSMTDKLTIFANGTLEYKGQWNTYDPKLWPKVLALGEMLHETKAEKVLYAKKFQPNDKVFYIIDDDEDCDFITVTYVTTEEAAEKYYSRDGKTKPTVESIKIKCFEEYNCEPVFIVDEIGDANVGWIPENALYLFTDMTKILFQK